jgi:hypothetical protein
LRGNALVDTILVLMQVGRGDDWSDRGLPEVVTGYDRAPSAVAAGAEWMFDNHPTPVGDDWRLLVWSKVRSGSWRRDRPDAVITPALYRAAIAERELRPSRVRRPKMLPVIGKIRVDQVEIGGQVLLTQDRSNAAARTGGRWFIASRNEPGCVAARVRGTNVLTRSDSTTTITLVTGLGEIGALAAGQPVIPVDED